MLTYLEENSFRTIILHCASTCFYGLAIFLLQLLTDQKYNLGKVSSLQLTVIFLSLEFVKCFLALYIQPTFDDPYSRREDRTQLFKKYFFKIKIKEILKCFLIFGVTVFIYFISFIVFGAEVFSKHEETLMLSILISVLTVVHSCINLGPQSTVNIALGMEPQSTVGKMVQRNIQGTLLGTWFGAFFIPLDWDRPWQEWPITCALGGIFGFTLSNFMSTCVVLYNHSKKEKFGRKLL